jgi:adenylate cyclase
MTARSGPPDPAPRRYPPAVSLVARSAGGRGLVPGEQSFQDIEDWLLADAGRVETLLSLFEGFVWRLVAAGLPLDRASLHVGTLHPQLRGFAWNWVFADGLCDEVQVNEAALQTDSFLRSPLAEVFRTGADLRIDPRDDEAVARYAVMADLRGMGITDYVAFPLGASGYHNVATLATASAAGFSAADISRMKQLLRLLAMHVERHIASRIAVNVVETYLGAEAGRAVLEGTIRRGEGRRIEAVIWVSDLRGFTEMSDRLRPQDMLSVLNAYFARMAGTVADFGGEVLKFIGDGLLAVFPLDRSYDQPNAATAAVAAALAAEEAVAELSRNPPPELLAIEGWSPLRSGIGLHVGEVFFGNVGAAQRLDFTVIGGAVNSASRVEGLTKAMGRPILMTERVARELQMPTQSHGFHALRGVSEKLELFSPGPMARSE